MANKRVTDRVRPEAQRTKRTPLHEQQKNRMNANIRDGSEKQYYYRWVNEHTRFGVRIEDFKDAGYEIAPNTVEVGDPGVLNENQSLGGGARKQVGVDDRGNPLYAILMRIPWELYKEDQEAKQAKVSATEEGIRRRLEEDSQVGTQSGIYGDLSVAQRKAGIMKTRKS